MCDEGIEFDELVVHLDVIKPGGAQWCAKQDRPAPLPEYEQASVYVNVFSTTKLVLLITAASVRYDYGLC